MTSINLVAHQNGVGLSRDVQLLANALRTLQVDVAVTSIDPVTRKRRRSRWVQWGVKRRRWWNQAPETPPKFDLNVMLEHVWPEQLDLANQNVAVPNPEWFDRHDQRFTATIDHVWAKTGNTKAIFEALGRKTTWIGFDSEDRFLADEPRSPSFFHLAGKSPTKGTDRLIAAWQQHPNWPTLTVLESREVERPSVPNVVLRKEFLSDDDLRKLQNASLFHLCPSETEGWGHYIVEAMSVGAVTVTIDAPPMNELVSAGRGLLLKSGSEGKRKLAKTHKFDEVHLATVIESAIAMSPAEQRRLGEAARAWFLDNKAGFARRVEAGVNAALH
jgi:glycosyltransferase involved in cell wall biosynthesis